MLVESVQRIEFLGYELRLAGVGWLLGDDAPSILSGSPRDSQTRMIPDRRFNSAGRAVVALLLLAIAGCSAREGRVSGKVTFNGQPLARAVLRFHRSGDDNPRPVAATSNENGEFRVIGFKDDTIPVGDYRVTAVKMALKDGTIPEGEKLVEAQSAGLLKNILPRVYEDVGSTPLQVQVHAGDNTLQLELKK